jgi:acetyl-CoA C-acetyltransferase
MEAPALGRVAALDAGLPVTASGLQIDRRCGSGLQAVLYAAMQVQTGASDVVLAGGAESMSNAPFYSTAMRWGVKAGPGRAAARRAGPRPGDRRRAEPPGARRDARDRGEPAPRVQDLPRGAGRVRRPQPPAGRRGAEEGRFADEIVPVTVSGRKGDTVVDRDEHIRPDSNVETLAKLRPIMGKDDPEATVTAGNASGQNDGAAVCVVTSRRRPPSWGCARWPGWSPGAWAACRRRRWASARCRPRPRRWRWPV